MPKAGKVYKYRNLIFWAQGGQICIEDTADGSYRVCGRAKFAARVIMMNNVLKRASAEALRFSDERNADYNFVTDGAAAVKEAKRQGDPQDPRVMEHWIKHHRPGYIFTGNSGSVVWQGPVVGLKPDLTKLPDMREHLKPEIAQTAPPSVVGTVLHGTNQ